MAAVRNRSKRAQQSATEGDDSVKEEPGSHGLQRPTREFRKAWRGALDWTTMLVVLVYGAYFVHQYQNRLPEAKSARAAGLAEFSEERALAHVKALIAVGPHPVGSDALEQAVKYVVSQVRLVQLRADPGLDVEISEFVASGYNRLQGGLFLGKTLAYSNLKSVVVRVGSKKDSSHQNAFLVSSHIDSVVTTAGAGDCSSCVAVMLELLRTLTQSGRTFENSVVFLFNTGEEEGLNGAHSFITQHPWRNSIKAFMDLESNGVGGRFTLFQAPDQWLLEAFAKVAPSPALQIMCQDVFQSGQIKSATDFQVYREVAGLSGLDFAFMGNFAVYHTKNDKIEFLSSGSLQQSGDNVLAFLREVSSSPELAAVPRGNATQLHALENKMDMVYLDILGKYAVTYTKEFANVLHRSVLLQSLLLFVASVLPYGLPAAISLVLALLTLLLTWGSSILFAVIISFIVPRLGSHAIAFIANPWLCIGLFGAPALLGALIGNWLGRTVLEYHLRKVHSSEGGVDHYLVEVDAERWSYKAGLVQWMGVLALGTSVNAGSSYLALSWLLFPAASYILLNYHARGRQSRSPLSLVSFWVGVIPPTILSADPIFLLPQFVIGNMVRFDRFPGGTPDWVGNILVAGLISVIICLWFTYFWPFVHRWGGVRGVIPGCALVASGALLLVFCQTFPAFTPEVGRTVNVVHVIETGSDGTPGIAYISLASSTPGNLDYELDFLADEGFTCHKGGPDFASYVVKYGCTKPVNLDSNLWQERPSLLVTSHKVEDDVRATTVVINTAFSHRWQLAINTNEIQKLSIESANPNQETWTMSVPLEEIIGVKGWHQIQYTTDQLGPHKFRLTLFWWPKSPNPASDQELEEDLLKLRTDVNLVTEHVSRIESKLPHCTSFGKSTSPYPLAYLAKLRRQNVPDA